MSDETLREALRITQWHNGVCPVCLHHSTEGHSADCTVRNALAHPAPNPGTVEGLRERIGERLANNPLWDCDDDRETDRFAGELSALAASGDALRETTRLICDTPFDGEVWRCEACDDEWVYNDGTPEENNMHYCHNCGRKIVEIIHSEDQEEIDDDPTPPRHPAGDTNQDDNTRAASPIERCQFCDGRGHSPSGKSLCSHCGGSGKTPVVPAQD